MERLEYLSIEHRFVVVVVVVDHEMPYFFFFSKKNPKQTINEIKIGNGPRDREENG